MNKYDLYADRSLVHPTIQETCLKRILLEYGAGDRMGELLSGQEIRVKGQDLKLVPVPTAGPIDLTKTDPAPSQQIKIGSSEMAAPNIAPAFEESLRELTDRAKMLGRRTSFLCWSAVVLAIWGIGLYALGIHGEPSTTIDQISVPSSVAKAFAKYQAGIGVHTSFDPAVLRVESVLMGILEGPLLKVIGALMLVSGIASAVLRQTLFPLFIGVFGATAPMLMTTFLSLNGFESESIKQSEFEMAVEAKSPEMLQRLLDSKEGLDEVAKSFILAQAFVAQGADSHWINQTAENLREDNMKGLFKVEPQVSYAIEHAADVTGTPEFTPSAQTYFDEAQAKSASYKRMSAIQLVLAGILMSLTLTITSLKRLILRRVKRITELLPALKGHTK